MKNGIKINKNIKCNHLERWWKFVEIRIVRFNNSKWIEYRPQAIVITKRICAFVFFFSWKNSGNTWFHKRSKAKKKKLFKMMKILRGHFQKYLLLFLFLGISTSVNSLWWKEYNKQNPVSVILHTILYTLLLTNSVLLDINSLTCICVYTHSRISLFLRSNEPICIVCQKKLQTKWEEMFVITVIKENRPLSLKILVGT